MNTDEREGDRAGPTDVGGTSRPAVAAEIGWAYRDDSLVVIDKPSGMLVHRGWAKDGPVALQSVRDALGRWVYPVHRLDRATSGLLVFALSSEIAAGLATAFAAGEVEKRYLALTRGRVPDTGEIDHPVPKDEGGERIGAQTSFRRLAFHAGARCSLVEVVPKTGRLHQIRRHLKHISHPLVGDVRYGKGDVNRQFRRDYRLHRLALHACRICFKHPVSGTTIELSCRPNGTLLQALLDLEFGPKLEQLGLSDLTSDEVSDLRAK